MLETTAACRPAGGLGSSAPSVARWLCDDGADYIHASLWDVSRMSAKRPDVHPLPQLRAAIPREVAIMTAGKIWTRDDAEATLARGADVLAFQRLWNRNAPDDPIAEDGVYGPMTEERVKRAPAEGFGIGASCASRLAGLVRIPSEVDRGEPCAH